MSERNSRGRKQAIGDQFYLLHCCGCMEDITHISLKGLLTLPELRLSPQTKSSDVPGTLMLGWEWANFLLQYESRRWVKKAAEPKSSVSLLNSQKQWVITFSWGRRVRKSFPCDSSQSYHMGMWSHKKWVPFLFPKFLISL